MRFPLRGIATQGKFLLLELAAFPVAVMTLLLLLLAASGAVAGTRFVGAFVGLDDGTVELLATAVVVLTAVVLVSAGALAVVGYRHFIARYIGRLRALAVVFVPLLGVLVPIGYGMVQLGSVTLPWWLFVIVAFSANVLAFRTIAFYALLSPGRRAGLLVGVLAGIPAVFAVTRHVTTNLLAVTGGDVGRELLAAVTSTQLPQHRWLLVVLPLLVAGAYAIRQSGAVSHLVLPAAARSVRSGHVAGAPETIRSAIPSVPTVPRPHISRRVTGVLSRKSADPRHSPESEASILAPPVSAKVTDSSAPPATSEPTSGTASSDDATDRASESADRGTSRSGTGQSSGSDASAEQSRREPPDEYTSDSDTQIFVDDFGAHASGRNPVETCPDCDEDIPSDGVYKFCPFCGCEL